MTLATRVNDPFIYDAVVDKDNKFMPNYVNYFSQLTSEVNSVLKYGRDSLGVGATNQKLIPFVQFPSLTTAQRDSVSGLTDGLVIYNLTVNKFQGYAGGVWVDFH